VDVVVSALVGGCSGTWWDNMPAGWVSDMCHNSATL